MVSAFSWYYKKTRSKCEPLAFISVSSVKEQSLLDNSSANSNSLSKTLSCNGFRAVKPRLKVSSNAFIISNLWSQKECQQKHQQPFYIWVQQSLLGKYYNSFDLLSFYRFSVWTINDDDTGFVISFTRINFLVRALTCSLSTRLTALLQFTFFVDRDKVFEIIWNQPSCNLKSCKNATYTYK